MRLASLTELKAVLEKTDSNDDTLLGMILDHTSKLIETHLNRDMAKVERTVYRDAGKCYYYLSAYPIDENATLTVTYNGTAQTKNTQFFVRSEAGLIEFAKEAIPSYNEPKELVIVWTGGYASSGSESSLCLDVPLDMKEAVLKQCAYNFRRRKDIGLSSVSMPDGSISKFSSGIALLSDVRTILKPYRRMPEIY